MAFVANPLSLSIPQANFEAWLRDSGYLEILDRCPVDSVRAGGRGVFSSMLRFIANPFGNITVEDLRREPVPWTGEFWDCGRGLGESYGWPLSGTQLKLRMEENMKRYMGNYLRLFVLIFLCFIYKMPLALLGIAALFGLWDTLRLLSRHLERNSFSNQILLLLAKTVSAVIIIYCKVALALCWAGLLSFAVIIVHSSLRKITSLKGPQKLEQKQ